MNEYLQALHDVLTQGTRKPNRTGVDTISLFGYQMRFDLQAGFPAVTTKKLAWRAVVSELLWIIEGSNDERRLCEILYGTRDPSKTTIWTANANADYWVNRATYPGDCGRIYGKQFRDWRTSTGSSIDQLGNLIDNIQQDPYSRRHVLVTYNPGEIDQMCLPPCHSMCQFNVTDQKLSCQLYQRSADLPLGSPFNIASYSLLTHMIAQICNLAVGEFIYTIGDAHIYVNQVDAIRTQLARYSFTLPVLEMPSFNNLEELVNTTVNQYKLIGYQHHPEIKIPFSV